MDGRPRERTAARPAADVGLRGPPRLLEAPPRRGSLLLRRPGRAPRALRRRDGLHPRRAAARDGAPVRRLVGLPGHVVLRTHLALRRPRRLQAAGGGPAQRGRRRVRGLGARALPQGRVRAGPLRRHRAVRGPEPLARRAPRLGHLRLQLRAQGGPQLPRRQRAVLAAGVPRRRDPRRRRGLDALPRLLARAGRVAAERARRPGEPRGRAVPPGDERHRLQERPRRDHRGRGVDLVAGCHQADRRRRPRLRLQVEHGLDARQPVLRAARPGAPQLPPPRADLLDGLRLLRELRAADQPRRGRARQGLPAAQDARRPLAAARQRARVPVLAVGAPRQAAALHGPGVRPGPRVGRAARARLVAAEQPRPRRRTPAGGRPEQRLRRLPRAVVPGQLPRRLPVDRRRRRRPQPGGLRPLGVRRLRGRVRHQLLRWARTRTSGSGCRSPASGPS